MMSAIASGETACASRSAGRYGRVLAVSSTCGATAFTRIPSGRNSRSSTHPGIRADGVDQHLGRTNPGGDLLDDAPRHGRIGRVAHLVPDAVGQLLQPFLVAIDADHREPGRGQLLHGRAAEL